MKNIPSFKQFKENYSLLESADNRLEFMFIDLKEDLENLEISALREGVFLDAAKNWASKAFLGPLGLSKVSYIDKARDVLLGLQLELLKREDEHETKLEEFKKNIESLSPEVPEDKPRIEALNRKVVDEKNVFDSYNKAQKLKIEKAKDIIDAAIDGNERRRAYAEAGLAEDKIILAEKEYEMAKKRSQSSGSLDELTDKIKRLRSDLEEKVKAFKDSEEEKEEKEGKINKAQKEIVSDPIAKKIIERVNKVRPRGIIDLKEEIKKDIASLEADHDRLEEELKTKKRNKKITNENVQKYKRRIDIIKAELEGRKKQLEILESLGKNSISIKRNIENPKKSQEILDTVNDIDRSIEKEKSKS